MKIKEHLDLKILENYGFQEIEEFTFDEDYELAAGLKGYYKDVASSRRGQYYCLLVPNSTREINIYATHADGSGTYGVLDDTILNLINDKIV